MFCIVLYSMGERSANFQTWLHNMISRSTRTFKQQTPPKFLTLAHLRPISGTASDGDLVNSRETYFFQVLILGNMNPG